MRIFNAMRPLDDTIVFIVVAAVSDANGSSPKSSAVSPSSFFSVVVVVALAPLAANPRAPSNARLNSSTSFIGTAIARASSTLNLAKSIGVVNQFASSVAAILAPTSSSLRPTAFAPAATQQPVPTALREIVKRTVEDPEFKEAMDKVETPIAYLDAPQFKTFLDRDAERLKVAVERIGKVPEN